MDPREYYAQALNGHRPAPIKVWLIMWIGVKYQKNEYTKKYTLTFYIIIFK